MKTLVNLLANDLKNITREVILVMSVAAPLLLAAVLRVAVPPLTVFLQEERAFDLAAHYPFLLGFLLVLTPMMLGTLIGFMILDERDEDIISFFSVTPLQKKGYLTFRILLPLLLNIPFSFLLLYLAGLAQVNFLPAIPVVLLASLEVPMMALLLGAFAGNKVEGLALSKGVGIMFLGPLAGYLGTFWWHLPAALLPPYWVAMAFLAALEGSPGYWFFTAGGILLHLLYIWLLYRQFVKRIN